MTEPKKKLSPISAIAVLVIGGLLYGGNQLREKWFGESAPSKVEAPASSKRVDAAKNAAAATEKAAAEKVAAEKAATEKAATEKVATEKAAAEKVAAEKSARKTNESTPSTRKPSRFSQERKRSRFEQNRVGRGAPSVRWGGIDEVALAFKQRRSDVFVEVRGKVVHVLPLDTTGSRHQNFLLELPNRITLKISHNIDLAPMIPGLRKGMMLRIRGEYEYNEKGGVVHWTHHDPARRHPDGWIELDGKKYG